MSFQPLADLNDCSCKRLIVTDIRGLYDAINNPDGYGSGNPAVGDIVTAILKLEMSNGVIYDNINIKSAGHYPSVTAGQELVLLESAIGGSLVDGLCMATITVTTSSATYTNRLAIYFTCGVTCCVQKLGAKIKAENVNCPPCQKSEKDAFLEAQRMLANLNYAAKKCCQFAEADIILKALQNLCQDNKCNNC